MAVGPTEALQSPQLFRITDTQVNISNRISAIVVSVMRGVKTARINPDAAIPPANSPQGVRTSGIGSQLDLDA